MPKILVSLPGAMVQKIDSKAQEGSYSRSEWIREAIREKLAKGTCNELRPIQLHPEDIALITRETARVHPIFTGWSERLCTGTESEVAPTDQTVYPSKGDLHLFSGNL